MFLPIIVILETIFTWVLITIPLEFLLTEKFRLIKNLKTTSKTEIFLLTLVVFFSLNYFWPAFKKFGRKILPVLGVLTVLSLFGYKKFCAYYDTLQRQPKIYSVSSDWSIQAKRIVIEGRGFGWLHDQSYVICGSEEFLIDSWEPNRIVAAAPLTGNFGKHDLQVVLHDGKKTRKIPFKFIDPIELSWKK